MPHVSVVLILLRLVFIAGTDKVSLLEVLSLAAAPTHLFQNHGCASTHPLLSMSHLSFVTKTWWDAHLASQLKVSGVDFLCIEE